MGQECPERLDKPSGRPLVGPHSSAWSARSDLNLTHCQALAAELSSPSSRGRLAHSLTFSRRLR